MERFRNKTSVYFGEDGLAYLKQLETSKILIITDPFMVESKLVERVTEQLIGKEYEIFSDVIPDPPLEKVIAGVKEMMRFEPHTVIAMGGGSAIDEAKAVLYFAKRIGKFENVELIAVPTTSGTGSEVTSFAVITDKAKGVKYPLVDDELLPHAAILDSRLVKTVPSSVTADTGMDVLTHALEAYVSTKANAFTDAFAEKAIGLVFTYLVRSYQSMEDKEAREQMHYASCMAGIAFNLTSLGINHAIAHNIGGKFKISHGRANAILLPYVVEFNADIQEYHPKEYSRAAKKYAAAASQNGMGGSTIRMSVKNLIREIQTMQKKMKLPCNFRECGININEFHKKEQQIAEGALADACIVTNPQTVGMEDVLELLKRTL